MSSLTVILVPEEEIYLAVSEVLRESLPELIRISNAEHGENWITPFASILDSYDENDLSPLPLVKIHLNEVKKKSRDPFVELGEYLLELECRFDRTTQPLYLSATPPCSSSSSRPTKPSSR